MSSTLLKRTHSLRNLEDAWRVIQQNGRFSKSEEVRAELQKFGDDASSNLRSLNHRLARGKFSFPPAKGLPIPKLDSKGRKTGKYRPIVLASVESRIVQRAVLNVLLEIPALQPFVKTPHSFGGIRAEKSLETTSPISNGTLSAVPAAISAALVAVGDGARFCASADIRAFFTKISKPFVTRIIAEAVQDEPFMHLFESAITVELANMVALREKADLFPSEDIGVAQGNSLSPLLGNILLADFDHRMNEGDCVCIRYIDDFIVFAPNQAAGKARLRRAIELLDSLGMDLSPEKSAKGVTKISDGFDFLGIEICPGLIRPTSGSQQRLLAKVDRILSDGKRALVSLRESGQIQREGSLLAVLRRLETTVSGWGKHYWFCNDRQTFQALDAKVWRRTLAYLGCYTNVRSEIDEQRRPLALGLTRLASLTRAPLSYPKVKTTT